MLARIFVPGEAFRLFAETDGLGLSLELHHLLSQKFNYLHVVLLKQLHVVISEAQMLTKLSSLEGLSADIALDLDLGAVLLYMISQLGSRHVLELLQVADVTAVLRTFVVLRMLLKRSNGHPSDLAVGGFVALVRELTKVDHVSYNWVHLLEQVVAFSFAVWALEFVIVIVLSIEVEFISVHLPISVLSVQPLGSLVSSGSWGSFKFHTVLFDEPFNQVIIFVLSPTQWLIFRHLILTAQTEYFIAASALERHEWELRAAIALDFFYELLLQFVLNFTILDVNDRHWIWAHDSVNSSIVEE